MASSLEIPVTLGTCTCPVVSFPVLIVIVTEVSAGATVPPSGVCEMTFPLSTSLLVPSALLMLSKPFCFSFAMASACVMPVTFGTSTPVCPVLTVSTMLVPASTWLPSLTAVPSCSAADITIPEA